MINCYGYQGLRKSLAVCLFCVLQIFVSPYARADDQVSKLIDQGAYPEALQRIDALSKEEGSELASLTLLKGALLVRMGRLDEGMRLFKVLAENYPNDAAIHNNIGVIHAERGQLEQAKRAFERAIEIKPEYHQAVRNLGDVHAEMACRTYGRIPVDSSVKIPAFCEAVEPKSIMPIKQVVSTASLSELTEPLMNEILEGLGEWRSAWEAQDVRSYLNRYSVEFKPKGLSLARWREQRERALARPEWIKIHFDAPQFSMANARISARFTQHYTASNYQDVVKKELVFIREGASWKIVSERIL